MNLSPLHACFGNYRSLFSIQGVVYDLLECIKSFLDNASLSQVPVYFISPVADSSLAHSNVYAEWYYNNIIIIII